MILDGIIGRLAADFVKARDLGVDIQSFVAEWKAAHPEFADDAEQVEAALSRALDEGTFFSTVTGSLTGALAAVVSRHGEIGKHSGHLG